MTIRKIVYKDGSSPIRDIFYDDATQVMGTMYTQAQLDKGVADALAAAKSRGVAQARTEAPKPAPLRDEDRQRPRPQQSSTAPPAMSTERSYGGLMPSQVAEILGRAGAAAPQAAQVVKEPVRFDTAALYRKADGGTPPAAPTSATPQIDRNGIYRKAEGSDQRQPRTASNNVVGDLILSQSLDRASPEQKKPRLDATSIYERMNEKTNSHIARAKPPGAE